MIFYGDSFRDYKENNGCIGGLKNTIKMEYEQEYDNKVFKKIYNLFRNDKNVKIEILSIEENKK